MEHAVEKGKIRTEIDKLSAENKQFLYFHPRENACELRLKKILLPGKTGL